jgi:hypothetical protein
MQNVHSCYVFHIPLPCHFSGHKLVTDSSQYTYINHRFTLVTMHVPKLVHQFVANIDSPEIYSVQGCCKRLFFRKKSISYTFVAPEPSKDPRIALVQAKFLYSKRSPCIATVSTQSFKLLPVMLNKIRAQVHDSKLLLLRS